MDNESWVIEVRDNIMETIPRGSGLEQYRRSSIYRVPTNFKELNTKSFEPHVASFGPNYHGREQLKPMEEQKQRAVAHFLQRSKKPSELLFNFVAEVAKELRDAYYPLDQAWKDDNRKFFQVMTRDACFMAEILLTAKHGFDGYAQDDPVFSKHGKLHIMPFIARDMLMLENQLPMLLLRKLFAFIGNKSEEEECATIYKLIVSFFPKLNFLERELENCQQTRDAFKNSLHILDVFRKSLSQPVRLERRMETEFSLHFCEWIWSCFPDNSHSSRIVRTATELEEAGIKFRISNTRSLTDISFQKGILRLPPIIVDDSTESTIRNLLAFEGLHVWAGNEVTSYVSFMDSLIDTDKDVAILVANGIIQNAFGSNEAVANLFNSVSKDIALEPQGKLYVVEEAVKRYCSMRWQRWRAHLVHKYFKSPWSSISLFAAIILFVLTALQTFYTAYQYHHPHPSPK